MEGQGRGITSSNPAHIHTHTQLSETSQIKLGEITLTRNDSRDKLLGRTSN